MKLWIKTHRIIKWLFPKYVWAIPNNNKKVFLTFDDGPIPEVTEFVLSELEKYQAKATFFCIGDNIKKNPAIFEKLIFKGHAIGNHTFNHLKGWKTETNTYVENVNLCKIQIEKHQISTKLLRPPYGKIKRSQAKILMNLGYKIVMWDVISADFDAKISPEECLRNVLLNVESGSIIVFHDSIKAFENLKYALPETLKFLNENKYKCEILT